MRNRHMLAVLGLVVPVGCGTIMHGPRQLVTVQSTPSGASVHVSPGSDSGVTPLTLNLERKHSYTITLTSPGYSSAVIELRPDIAIGTAFADGFFTGMIGAVVDAIDGSLYGLKPESPNVTLTRSASNGSGPQEIHIRLLESDGGRQVEVQSDARAEIVVEVCDSSVPDNARRRSCRDK